MNEAAWRARYGQVLGCPGLGRAAAGAFLGRLSQGVAILGILLLIRLRTGAFADAGAVVTAYSAAAALCAPLSGRLADRYGSRFLWVGAVVNPAGLVGLVLAVRTGTIWLMVLAAGVAGASQPPLSSAFRALCAWRLTGEPLEAAYGLDAVATELTFIAGPPLAGISTGVGRPEAALYGAAALTLIGTALFISAPSRSAGYRQPTRQERGRLGQLLPALPLMLTVSLTMMSIAFIEVAIVARTVALGHPADSGLVLATWAGGSVAGGLAYGSRRWPGQKRTQYAVALLLIAILCLPLAGATSLWILFPTAVLAGLAVAPAGAIAATILGGITPAHNRTEAFTWVASASAGGGSLGYVLAGAAVSAMGTTAPILAAAVLTTLALPFTLGLPSLIPIRAPGVEDR